MKAENSVHEIDANSAIEMEWQSVCRRDHSMVEHQEVLMALQMPLRLVLTMVY
jgi:hypothetical protein